MWICLTWGIIIKRWITTDANDEDTDGDGIPDGSEATPWWVVESLAHPTKVIAETPANLGETTSETAGWAIREGTDALQITVRVVTTEDSYDYEDYNDELTFSIRGPLPGLPIEKTVHLTGLGVEATKTIINEELIICHAQALESTTYLTIEATAKHGGSAQGGNSRVIVQVGAIRVELVEPMPPPEDRYHFDDHTPGELKIYMAAQVSPNAYYYWKQTGANF